MPKALNPDIEGYSFFFYSNEGNEPRHVHVWRGDGMAKYWLEPDVELADTNGRFKVKELKRAEELVKKHTDKIKKAWDKHFQQ